MRMLAAYVFGISFAIAVALFAVHVTRSAMNEAQATFSQALQH